ncbi:MAG: putative N6-adenine-specific DNA methylase [Flavobacteriales bacterium]|jgi:putative N6-adenine-specific DNA methylase
MTHKLVATTFFGLEEVLEKELINLGAQNVEVLPRAVSFEGDDKLLYKANLWLRTAVKVLKPIAEFDVNDEQELYKKAKMIDWQAYFNLEETFAIDGTCSGTIFTHSKYIALKLKDAIADQFRTKFDKRPNVDVEDPTVRFNIRIAQNKCTISIDSSGLPLTKRGYRTSSTSAPLNEGLAAGLILLTDWDATKTLIDPMCGSGTIAIEGAMIATNTAPGMVRVFAFQKWNNFNDELWKEVKEEAKAGIITGQKVLAMDSDRLALRAARENAERAGMKSTISFELADFTQDPEEYQNAVLIMNPPYGERLERTKDMTPFYKAIGTQLKHRFGGSQAWIISSNEDAMKSIGLKTSRKIKLFNGALECKYHGFDLYEGSKKFKKNN